MENQVSIVTDSPAKMSQLVNTIRTPDQRLRVFLSSTLQELASERKAAQKAVRQMGMTPVLFEIGARPYPPRDLYRAYLNQSDIFIGIYWEKYGWIAPDMNISGLEDEYRLSGNMPRLIYLKNTTSRDPELQVLIEDMSNAGLSYKHFNSDTELEELILNDLAILLTEKFTSNHKQEYRSSRSHSVTLPYPSTSLIGRDKEVVALTSLLLNKDTRLTTLTGPGGVGKSRLSLEVAHRVESKFADGVYYVRLASVKEADLVPATIFRLLYPDEAIGNNPIELLLIRLRDKRMCLVLDNFEQVINAATFISQLLEACPAVSLLITSRETLRIAGEHEFPVKPLPLIAGMQNFPEADELLRLQDNAAVQLFVQRCQAVMPDFELQESNAFDIAYICNALEGLPLAIELAAARIKLFTPKAMVRMLHKKLDFLSSTSRDLPVRHQTLRATIQWSYNLLTEEEQYLLRQITVFSGGFTLITLQGMLDIKDQPIPFPRIGMFLSAPIAYKYDEVEISIHLSKQIESLLSKNLLYTRADRNGEQRFHLYQTIRDFALEQLDKEKDVNRLSRSHLLYFLQLTESVRPQLNSHDSLLWLALLDEEQSNITSALTWALENAPTYGLRIAVAICEYWDTRANTADGTWWLSELSERAIKAEGKECSKICAIAWLEMARLYFRDQELENLRASVKKTEDYLIENEDPHLKVDVASFKIMTAGFSGKEKELEAIFDEALTAATTLHYEMQILNLLQSSAAGYIFSGSPEKGLPIALKTFTLAQQIGAHRWTAISSLLVGFAHMISGKLTEATTIFKKCCGLCLKIGDRIIIIHPLIGLSQVSLLTGKAEQGAKLLGAIHKFMEQPGIMPVASLGTLLESVTNNAKAALGNLFQQYFQEGYSMKIEDIPQFALETV